MTTKVEQSPLQEVQEDVVLDMLDDVSGEMEKTTAGTQGSSTSLFGNLTAGPIPIPHLGSWLLARRQGIRAWSTFLNAQNFTTPNNIRVFTTRILSNLSHFQSNYLIIFLLLIAYCLITSPLLLLVIVLSAYGGNKIVRKHEQNKFRLMGRELTNRELYGAIGLCTLPLFYLVGVGSIVFWALGASVFVIGLHATFFNSETRELTEEQFGLIESI